MSNDKKPAPESLAALAKWDTPTICNGLEIVCPERRMCGFTTRPLVALDASLPPVIGYACTARYRSAAPSVDTPEVMKKRRLDYYKYLWEAPQPGVVVVEDLDDTPGIGAFWGEVHTTVHKGLGMQAGITNGSMRDLPDSAPGFQLLAGNVGPSHAHGHLVDFGSTVTVHNMTVNHGDIIHLDMHGAVVIPPAAVEALPAAIELIAKREAKILTAARSPDFSYDMLEAAIGSAEDIH